MKFENNILHLNLQHPFWENDIIQTVEFGSKYIIIHYFNKKTNVPYFKVFNLQFKKDGKIISELGENSE